MNIKRGFLRIEEGQVHYRAVGKILNSKKPLVMIHSSPASALNLQPLMQELHSIGVSPIYAPDTLGNGDSCKPKPTIPDIDYYADTLKRQLKELNVDNIDLYGTHTGGSIALELAIQEPSIINKLIIDGIGMYSEEDKVDMINNYAPEIKPDIMGTQLNWAWHFIRDQNFFFPWYKKSLNNQLNKGISNPDSLHDSVVEVLKSLDSYHHAYRAAFNYPKKEKLKEVKSKILLIYEKNDPLYRYKNEALISNKNITDAELDDNTDLTIKAKKILNWLNI
ncbi:alpha/beta hydrolase [Alphaproteobacteria bacterium]|nr:alpha/beta hydrolase [Alphaproteobacteria bacterium]